MLETIEWTPQGVVMIDQTLLPTQTVFVTCKDYLEVAHAIKTMIIRGAPAIGVAAAMGVAIGVQKAADPDAEFATICDTLAATRPTAVNLFWGIERMKRLYKSLDGQSADAKRDAMIAEAIRVKDEDVAICKEIGRHGAPLVPDNKTVLTHCNAGALATGGWGTALGVIRSAHAAGKLARVFACETRPYLQGARLTAWELAADGIPVEVLTDGMVGHFLARGEIHFAVVGADRVAANGDVANKIGTYGLAIAARAHGARVMVVAPLSTFDPATVDGASIPIEERAGDEITTIGGRRYAPAGVEAYNPVFDVTPAALIDVLVTEAGVVERPDTAGIAALLARR